MGCWRTSLPRPRPISRGLALTKPLIVFTPSPFLRHRYGPSLTLCSPCPPPQYNYGFVVEKTAAARLPPSVS